MKTLNYLTINELGMVELHGFVLIKDFVYVEMFHNKEYMLLIAHKREETKYCFKVKVNNNRTIDDKRVIELVKNNKIENKRFIQDLHFDNYLSTKISV